MTTAFCRSRRSSRTAATAAALLGLAVAPACDSSKAHTGAVGSAHGYQVTYAVHSIDSGDGTLQVVTDGGAKVKVTAGNGADGYVVSDATRATKVAAGGIQTATMKVSDVRRFVLHDNDGTLAVWCPGAKKAGTAEVLNQPTRHYTCTKWNPDADASGPTVQELWVDQHTGLVMQWNVSDLYHATASQVDNDPTLTASTFALPPPSGAQDQQHLAASFTVPSLRGGELSAVSYRRAPLVIVSGDAASIRALVDRLLPMTGGGKSPRVIALLAFNDFTRWKGSLLNPTDVAALVKLVSASAGTFKVPVGIDFKGGAAEQLAHLFDVRRGGSHTEAHVVLIDSAGTVARVALAGATDDELKGWIGDLS